MKIYAVTEPTLIPVTDITEPIRVIYDALCSSADAGSGFLDTEDWEALLVIARVIDATNLREIQAKVTRAKNPNPEDHDFKPDRDIGELQFWELSNGVWCLVCGRNASNRWGDDAGLEIHGLSVVNPDQREEAAQEMEADRLERGRRTVRMQEQAALQARRDAGEILLDDF